MNLGCFYDLQKWTTSLSDYKEGIALGTFVEKELFVDDPKFEQSNPAHPLCLSMRSRRIDAADLIRNYAQNKSNWCDFNSDTLDIMHTSLFDCCAAVRMSIAEALIFVGDKSSIAPLHKILEEDNESTHVRKTAEAALARLEPEKISSDNTIVSCLNNGAYIRDLYLWCCQNKFKLVFAEPDTSDIIAFPAKRYILNIIHLGKKTWNILCDFLNSAYPELIYTSKPLIIALGDSAEETINKWEIFPINPSIVAYSSNTMFFDPETHLYI